MNPTRLCNYSPVYFLEDDVINFENQGNSLGNPLHRIDFPITSHTSEGSFNQYQAKVIEPSKVIEPLKNPLTNLLPKIFSSTRANALEEASVNNLNESNNNTQALAKPILGNKSSRNEKTSALTARQKRKVKTIEELIIETGLSAVTIKQIRQRIDEKVKKRRRKDIDQIAEDFGCSVESVKKIDPGHTRKIYSGWFSKYAPQMQVKAAHFRASGLGLKEFLGKD